VDRRTFLAASLAATAGFPALAEARVMPPAPLANLRVFRLPRGTSTVEGPADQDLLLVAPPGKYDFSIQCNVSGFRAVWLVGAHIDRPPTGWLNAPNGNRVDGTHHFLSVKNHAHAQRPFVFLADIDVLTHRICFGDLFKVGGAAPVGQWRGWPDVWMQRIRVVPGVIGWGGYYGGSFSHDVSHSDFRKADNGGWRHIQTVDCALGWGFQCCFDVPSFATDFRDYAGPDGPGISHFANTTWRPILRHPNFPQAGTMAQAAAIYMEVANNQHKRFSFGSGCGIVPPAGHSAGEFVLPRPFFKASGNVLLPNKPWISGQIRMGQAVTPAAPKDVRISSRSQLMSYLGY
jgi:hypothetical protein